MSDEAHETRRRVLTLAAAAGLSTALAGCGGGGGGESTSTPTGSPSPTSTGTEGGGDTTAGGTTAGGTPTGTVPAAYETATSQGGAKRNPSGLSTKAAVKYQTQPNGGQQCSGCQFFIPIQGDAAPGACAIVEGPIQPDGWCVSYAALQTETGSG